jgi:hypothetical protein
MAGLWAQRQAAEVEPEDPLEEPDPELEDEPPVAAPLEDPLPEEPLLEDPLLEEPLPADVPPAEPDEAFSLPVDADSPEELPPPGAELLFAPLRESVR